MSIVSKICFSRIEGEELLDVSSVKVIANKGIVNDRYFKDNNNNDKQITLIESEILIILMKNYKLIFLI